MGGAAFPPPPPLGLPSEPPGAAMRTSEITPAVRNSRATAIAPPINNPRLLLRRGGPPGGPGGDSSAVASLSSLPRPCSGSILFLPLKLRQPGRTHHPDESGDHDGQDHTHDEYKPYGASTRDGAGPRRLPVSDTAGQGCSYDHEHHEPYEGHEPE